MDYTLTSLLCTCLLLLHLSNMCFSIPPGVLREVCLDESFIAECETGEVVVMEKALYGRMKFGRCMRIDYGYLGCQQNVLSLADRKCSGKKSCSIRIPDPDFDKMNVCPRDLKIFFEGSYRCVKVVGTQHVPCKSSAPVKLTSRSGSIASSSVSSRCGTVDSPWIIEAQPGQVIQVSLIDFRSVAKTFDMCHVYAILKEKANNRATTICRGTLRNRDVYLTEGNSLEIRILRQQRAGFLIECKVLGCPNLQLPGHHISREGDHAVVSCDNKSGTWHITCKGTLWHGYIGNCSSLSSGSSKALHIMDYTTSLWCTCLLLLHLIKMCFSVPSGVRLEVCVGESFTAECETGEVVVMEKALIGRMALGRCIRKNYGYIGCYADVLGLADQKCSGRQSCSIRIPDDDFDRVHPCPKDFKTYFEGSYRCVKVVEVQHELCRTSDFFKLTSPSGFIASSSASSGCGTWDSPWIIEAQPGQVILVSIMNFGYWPHRKMQPTPPQGRPSRGEPRSVALTVCAVYAVLREKASSRSITICGGSLRIRDVYLTEGNSLEVWIPKRKGAQFLLGWKVLGCPDPQVLPSVHFSREGDHAVLSCDNSNETWHITCNGTSWNGDIGNCSSLGSGSTKDSLSWTDTILLLLSIGLLSCVLTLLLGMAIYYLICVCRGRVSDKTITADPCENEQL